MMRAYITVTRDLFKSGFRLTFKPVFSWCSVVAVMALTACASMPVGLGDQPQLGEVSPEVLDNAWTRFDVGLQQLKQPAADKPQWQHYHLPGKQATQYTFARLDGRDAMAVTQ